VPPANTDPLLNLLTEAAEHMAEAVRQADFAYRFCPGSYTASAMQSCLAAAKRLNRCRALAASLAAPPEPSAPKHDTPSEPVFGLLVRRRHRTANMGY
jgi:hypothetical protein